jgi:hypothetical protein
MMCEHPAHKHTLEPWRLYQEATSVGILLVPVWFLTSKATEAVKIGGTAKPFVDVALAGFLFHLVAEESGMNEWYLSHSYAAQKVLHPKQNNDLLASVADVWSTLGLDTLRAALRTPLVIRGRDE